LGIVKAVFYGPMAADGVGGEGRRGLKVGDIIGALAGVFPKAGLGAALQAVTL
jgi:hypothetical protein